MGDNHTGPGTQSAALSGADFHHLSGGVFLSTNARRAMRDVLAAYINQAQRFLRAAVGGQANRPRD
jgi:hypothetical protein